MTKTQEQRIQTQLRTGKSNSDYWRIVRNGILGSGIASAILTQGLFAFAQMEPASKLTLQVPRTNEVIDASTWCQASDAVGTGRPFGFNRVRFYQEKTDLENREYLIGCVTNNTEHTVESISASYSIEYPPYTSTFAAGFSSLSMLTLQPGQTGFFRTGFTIDSEAIGLEINLQRLVRRGQRMTYEPVERLVIQRRQ
ncbi:MAG: hypothetical protein RIE73_20065 [Coleofasciculus sp. C1-SOL-03]|uniref:hypothetical protein n=1 Tax=Coleofasciculus sp. C1-SOL-03 TaxID=3069522 RepID=UPI003302B797